MPSRYPKPQSPPYPSGWDEEPTGNAAERSLRDAGRAQAHWENLVRMAILSGSIGSRKNPASRSTKGDARRCAKYGVVAANDDATRKGLRVFSRGPGLPESAGNGLAATRYAQPILFY